MRIKQDSKMIDDDWWEWSVELDAPDEQLDKVKFVEYTLHETFPDPIRRITDRRTNFRLKTAGWGVFMIYAKVMFEDQTHIRLHHFLELIDKEGKRVTK